MRSTIFAAACGLCLLVPMAPADSFLARKSDDWKKDLQSAKPATRRSAAFALGRMGIDGAAALTELARLAEKDDDKGVREAAASAVGEIANALGDGASYQYAGVSGSLEKALGDKEDRVRRAGAYALGAFGKSASASSAALRKRLEDKTPSVRQNAAWALGRLGKPEAGTVEGLIDRLRDSDTLVRRDSAAAIQKVAEAGGDVSKAGKPLLELAASEKEDAAVRKTALGALATMSGPEHATFAPGLYALLQSKDDDTQRAGAAYVLGRMGGEPAQKAMPILKEALKADDPEVQEQAAVALARAGTVAGEAVKELADTLVASRDNTVRRNCCIALALIGKDRNQSDAASQAVGALGLAMKPTKDTSRAAEEVRGLAAEALAQMGNPANQAAMANVRDAIKGDRDRNVRHRCIWATFNAKLEQDDLIKPLEDVMADSSEPMKILRHDAARSLAVGLEDRVSDKVVEVLLKMIVDKTVIVFRETSVNSKGAKTESGNGGSEAKQVANGDARYMAAQALGLLGAKVKKDQKVIDALNAAAKDKDEMLADHAKKALEKLGK